MRTMTSKRRQLSLAIMAASVVLYSGQQAVAQSSDAGEVSSTPRIQAPVIEEVLTVGRLQSASDSIIDERIEQPYAADVLGFDQISRAGDSDIAAALSRVTGLTVVDNQYVYVRSLGERYSTTRLNGAAVPSPELTRNVLPLDLLPSSIVKTLKVQKAYSPNLPATFGGGSVDIRTKGIPDDVVFDISIGTGWNSQSSNDGLTYSGGDVDNGIPVELGNALTQYQGDPSINGILNVLHTSGGAASAELREQAEQINRDLILSLDRDVEITSKSLDPDVGAKVSLGNSWYVSDDWRIGALANLSYDKEWRNKNQEKKGVGNPDTVNSKVARTTEEVKELASVSAGVSFQEMHTIEASGFFITNTEDLASITEGFNNNNTLADGSQRVDYQTRFEERRLEVLQVTGDHAVEFDLFDAMDELSANWYYSDSKAETAVPNETNIQGSNTLNPATGELIDTALLATTSVATFAFLQLEDNVESYGLDVELPLNFGNNLVTLSGGYDYNDKSRAYYGYTANINTAGISGDVLAGTPGAVLSDDNLSSLENGFNLSMGTATGQESYIAAQMTDAAYGMIDINFDYTWRVNAGVRYEDFRQAVLPIDLLDHTGESIRQLNEELAKEGQSLAIKEDGWYPSLALTYMNQGFMDADDFQVRAAVSQSVIRPDLREMSNVSYIDPDLGILVQGNPLLKFSEINHLDLRTEWFYGDGDNLTVSFFYKEISDPIEQTRKPASDDDISLEYYNATSGEIYGLEFEGKKGLGRGLFVSGNLTLSDSEIVSPDGEGFTNTVRRMTGQSEYVMNAQLGFDSDDGMHTASLLYNVFGDRVYYAARSNGHQDAFEMPYHSLDLVYTFYPTETLSLKLKLSNLLDQDREFEQVNAGGEAVTILKQEQGTGVGLDFKYSF
ncbi:TonB-dependent receptor [Gilvimarinus agarilyticus]|uniref:TonB-dependent receptor domain-containing protein n=1 Tax=Gilvimarinus sp. 2_MG-2023 TaxID=3062666 RepID=UPI001C085115|nr:TonB-dependent receptor [Gilvimarinus sp. 2_MG-2023]MBU2887813.1 TonB-dependent receptor [Gilvimarinus agarilyticus]MDO6572452.1 TonB-dependent receptor [Gilvimarinus sp. 2_MG-2023]